MARKHRTMAVTVVEDCPPFPPRGTRKGDCKYPFDRLDAAGKGLDVTNRTLSTVKDALKRWRAVYGEGMAFTVRQIDVNKVRVRRDK